MEADEDTTTEKKQAIPAGQVSARLLDGLPESVKTVVATLQASDAERYRSLWRSDDIVDKPTLEMIYDADEPHRALIPVDLIDYLVISLVSQVARSTHGTMELQCLVEGIRMAGDGDIHFPDLCKAILHGLRKAFAGASIAMVCYESEGESLAFATVSKIAYICRLLALHLQLDISLLEERTQGHNSSSGKVCLIYQSLYNEAHLAPPAVKEAFG